MATIIYRNLTTEAAPVIIEGVTSPFTISSVDGDTFEVTVGRAFQEATAGTVPVPAPVIAISAFNDTTDTGVMQTDTPDSGFFEYAVVARGATAPTPLTTGGWSGTVLAAGFVAVGADGASVVFTTTSASGTGDKDLYVVQRVGTVLSNVATQQFNLPAPAPSFAFSDSVVDTTFASTDWGSRTLDGDGYWVGPSTNGRADTNAGAFAVPASTVDVTYCVDVALVSGTNTTFSTRISDIVGGVTVQTSGAVNTTTWTLSSGTGGVIALGGGVYRVWNKRTVAASSRVFVDFPTTANSNIKMRKPAIFYANLTVEQIGALV